MCHGWHEPKPQRAVAKPQGRPVRPQTNTGPKARITRPLQAGRFVVAPLLSHKNYRSRHLGHAVCARVLLKPRRFTYLRRARRGDSDSIAFINQLSESVSAKQMLTLLAIHFGSNVGRKISGVRRSRPTSLRLFCVRVECAFL